MLLSTAWSRVAKQEKMVVNGGNRRSRDALPLEAYRITVLAKTPGL
jgi:hypothetical protein